ncbi:hypothetical protein HMPREF1984_01325 [Leptotrichia sp. oral taxon 215 str. W9775]|nr:hypothetical protein [Leptotrichia sp. oral taxon 215]ERK67021.1 hypothetical protein HMPREF1984_01325 [Leptotrichia sp. oral taxon 215 str. W9775]
MEKLRLPKKIIKNEKDYGVPIRIRSSTHSLLDNIEWIPSEEYVKDNGGR